MKHVIAVNLVLVPAWWFIGCTSEAATPLSRTLPSPAAVADPPRVPATAPPSPGVVRSSTVWSDGGIAGVRVRTEHYNLHLALKDPTFRDMLPAYMEACHFAYATVLGELPIPNDQLELYIFSSRSPWEEWTKNTLGKDADIYLGLGRGGFTADGVSVLYDLGRVDTLTIAAHEGWHQFSQKSLKHPLPTYLEEGLACWMEGTRLSRDGVPMAFKPWKNFERWTELRNAFRDENLISLGELLETSPQLCLQKGKNSLLTYYAQCWALIHFLHDGEQGKYRPSLLRLMKDAAEGKLAAKLAGSRAIANPILRKKAVQSRTGNGVMLEYFNPDFSALKGEYDRFVVEVCKRGAGDRIFRGESPLTAAAADSKPLVTQPPAAQPPAMQPPATQPPK